MNGFLAALLAALGLMFLGFGILKMWSKRQYVSIDMLPRMQFAWDIDQDSANWRFATAVVFFALAIFVRSPLLS